MSTVPFTLLGIDHDVIRARDIKTMMSFYLDVLNCEIERKVPDIGPYQLRAGRALIDFDDIEASPVKPRNVAVGEGSSIYLDDPEGNRIEIKGPAAAP